MDFDKEKLKKFSWEFAQWIVFEFVPVYFKWVYGLEKKAK